MMKLLSIALATAAFTVDAGTNKTLASTPANVIDSVLLPPLSSTTTMEAEQPDLNSDEAYDPFLGLQQRNLEDVVPPLENGQCSCSPLEYNFILNPTSNCETDDINGQPGIGLAICFEQALPTSRILSELQRTIVVEDPNSDELSMEQQQQQIRFLAVEDIEITAIQFLEFDTSEAFTVINQDDTYSSVSLANGDVVTFESIAKDLDPNIPIEEQLDYLPGGAQVTLQGRGTDDVTGEILIVSNRITWSYTNACDVWPVLESEDSIGWITIVSIEYICATLLVIVHASDTIIYVIRMVTGRPYNSFSGILSSDTSSPNKQS